MSDPSEWLHSPKVEQFLKRARVTAMILMRDETVITKYGQLSPEGFQQFIDGVQRHWPGKDHEELDRHVVLALDAQFQCLCSTRIPSGGYLLSLAFPMDVPLKYMRRDVAELMNLMTTFDDTTETVDERLEQSLQLTEQPTSKPDPSEPAKVVSEGW